MTIVRGLGRVGVRVRVRGVEVTVIGASGGGLLSCVLPTEASIFTPDLGRLLLLEQQ
jgi:hypothetical protein